ncbi:MAG: Holliday junction branch migration protein RuvA [Clostridiales bacterium]|nr:Holliday junction branch migration protein RuvA [Clostridiales bacterium]
MFYSLTGKIIAREVGAVAVSCAGIGFYCRTSANTLSECGSAGDSVTLYTYLSVSESGVDLYGFADLAELNCFKMLIGVSGVGPKAAISMLSAFTADRIAVVIASGDYRALTKAQGVGPKLAQRVVNELKDKISATAGLSAETAENAAGIASASSNAAEAVSALVVLGYSPSDAATAVARTDGAQTVEAIIKAALKILAGGV